MIARSPSRAAGTTVPEWMARLEAADCTAADREAFERWRHASPENRAAFARYQKLCAMPRELASNAEIFAELVADADARAAGSERPGRLRAFGASIAAGLACLAIAAWYLFRGDQPLEYVAPATEQRTVALSDGSFVTM